MSRYIRNTAIQLKIESAYGTDPGSWAATDALLISNATFDNPQEQVARELLRGHMGGFEQLNTTGSTRIQFDVEFSGSGETGVAPAWGRLLRAAGMAETVTADTRVDYTPVSSAFESATLRYSLDGVIYTCVGCRGTVTVMANAFDIPKMRFDMMGLQAAPSAATTPAGDFTAWKRPLPINEENGAELLLGCTYTAGVIAGGAQLKSQGLELMLGHTLNHQKILNGQEIDITAREATGRGTVFLAAADEVSWHAAMTGNGLTTFGFNLGTEDGAKVGLFAPSVQRSAMRPQDYQGRLVQSFDLRLIPSAANDDLRIVAA